MTHRPLHARLHARLLAGALALPLLLGLASCSKSDSSDTTVAADTTAAPADTTAAPADTTAAVAETSAVPDSAASTDSTATDTGAASAAGAEDAVLAQVLAGILGTGASEESLSCVKSKLDPGTLANLETDTNAMKPMFKALLDCEPEAMSNQFVGQAFSEYPEMTDDQKSCMGAAMVEVLKTDEVLDAMLSSAEAPPAALKTSMEEAVKDCVSAGALRDKLLTEMND